MVFNLEDVKTAYDELSSKVKDDLDQQFIDGKITGNTYANVYLSLMDRVLNLAFNVPMQDTQINAIQQKLPKELEQLDANIAQINASKDLTLSQKSSIDSKLPKELDQIDANTNRINASKDLTLSQKNSIDSKLPKELEQLDANIDKTIESKNFTITQKDALNQQVVDNEKIKAAQILGDTYQGFGTNGLTVSSDMWTTFFNLVNDIYTITKPTDTGVTRV